MEKIQIGIDPELIDIGSKATQQLLQVHLFGNLMVAAFAAAFMFANVSFFKYLKRTGGHELLGFPVFLGAIGFIMFTVAMFSAAYVKFCPDAYILENLMNR